MMTDFVTFYSVHHAKFKSLATDTINNIQKYDVYAVIKLLKPYHILNGLACPECTLLTISRSFSVNA